ncbi:cobalt/nickel transport protein [Pedococcus dokdonensis]|uniref:Cobalt/nickel transport protein n=1 Tax=Pedococcus dokdonensis TaxID=443156 RepID=A0A1H0QQQ8_9MICO|nr:PDGLE domain-containing protein [Pedococcus dokdonensis]SDP19673.1 cobalt/nickel transport protein [Pedococcus dokdonensis]
MSTPRPRVTTRRLMVVGILVCAVLAGVVSFYASSHPDGLEFVAGEKGFLGSAGPHASDGSPFAGYATRGVDDARFSGGIAGLVGGAVVFVIAGGLFLAIRRRDRSDISSDTGSGGASDSDA